MKYISTILVSLILSFGVNAQVFDWQWQNPKPHGNNLNDVTALSTTRLVAGGDAGTIQVSTDGGNTWVFQTVDITGNGVNALYFVNSTLGFLCGEGGLIMKTADGGDNWSSLSSGTTEILWDVEFVDADTGYVVGNAGTLLKTTNGGTTWSSIISPMTNTLYSVSVKSADDILIGTSSSSATQILSRSTDYGATWQDVTPVGYASSVYAIKFVDNLNGYAGGSSGKVLKTTDGGATFTEITDFGSGSNYSLYFSDANTGYVPSGTDVYITTDGGTTWNPSTASDQTLRGIAPSASGLVAIGNYGTSLLSSDNGATWQPKFEYVTQEMMREIHFVDANTGYAPSGSTTAADSLGFILKTTNGGDTWVMMPYNFKFQVYTLDMPSSTVWYAATGDNKIYKTTDAGATWTSQTQPISGTTNDFYKIRFSDIDTGYTVGQSGNILKTVDGGANWTALTSPFGTSTIYDMHVFDSQTVIAVGLSSKAYKTTDGGANWDPLTTGIPGSFFSMRFLNSSFGVIAGFSSPLTYLSITKDGGDTWVPTTLPSSFDAFSSVWGIGIKDTNTIWFSDVNGSIGYTNDGGANWYVAKAAGGNGIYDISIVGNDMWIAGQGGNIIKGYSDSSIPVELVSFNAVVDKGNVLLKWSTATETNNAGFEIERSVSSANWNKIGFVGGAGTTTEKNVYSFTDKDVQAGKVFYRLKQIDFDGTYDYSNVVEVNTLAPSSFAVYQNYPNPFNPTTNIKFDLPVNSNVKVSLINMIGEETTVLDKDFTAGTNEVTINASGLASGVYVYMIKAVGENGKTMVSSKKMILLR